MKIAVFVSGSGTNLQVLIDKLHLDKDVDVENTKPYTKEDTAYREFKVKLRKVKDRMLTGEGKKIAEKRHRFMVNFFDRLNKEVDGVA